MGSWNDIAKETIQNCFRRTGLCVNDISNGLGLAHASKLEFSELWQELACFLGTVPEGIEFDELVGVDRCSLANAKIFSGFVRDTVKDVSNNNQPEHTEGIPTLTEALATTNLLPRHCMDIGRSRLGTPQQG